MCGIWGLISAQDLSQYEGALSLLSDLTDINQERGQVAYGAYVDGEVFKGEGVIPQGLFLSRHPRRVVLAHSRAPTGGSPVDYDNNHPFYVGGLWLAHNGILINHEELRADLGVPSSIVTDSIVILYGIWKRSLEAIGEWSVYQAVGIVPAIKKTCEVVKGSYACWLWGESTRELFLFRCIAPLFICQFTKSFAFSSERFPSSEELPEGKIVSYNFATHMLEDRGSFRYYSPYKV